MASVGGFVRAAAAAGRAFAEVWDAPPGSPPKEHEGPLAKAQVATQTGAGDLLMGRARPARKGAPNSYFEDPYLANYGLGYKERFYGNATERTREIIANTPVVAVIINTLAAEVQTFGKPLQDRHGIGFRVRLRDKRERASRASEARCRELTAWLEHTGDPDTSALRDSFATYLRKLAKDSLSFAQDATEIVPGRDGKPSSFYAVDASTIRLAHRAEAQTSGDLEKEVRYVQVVGGAVVTTYTHAQMIFGVRNPVSDIRMAGYGLSEIEEVMRVLSALLMTWEYNVRAFTSGTNVRGIANIKEELSFEQFEAARDDFMRFAKGVDNAHGTLLMNATQGMDYHDLSRSNQELGYDNWQNFLIKLLCAAYRISPSLLNLDYGATGVTSTIGGQQNPVEKIQEGRTRALKPILGHLFDDITTRLVYPIDEAFVAEPCGLDAQSAQDQEDLNQKRVRSTRTVDEVRAEDDLAPLPDGQGSVILDPTWAQLKAQATFAAQGGAPGGAPAAAGDDKPDSGAPAPRRAPAAAGDKGGEPDDADESRGLDAGAPDKGGRALKRSLGELRGGHLWTVHL